MKRTLLLAVCIMVLTAFAASCTNSTCPQAASSAPAKTYTEDEVVAWVNDAPIPKSLLDEMVKQMPPYMKQQIQSPEGMKNLVENLVNVELVYQKAEKSGFANTEAMKEKIFQVSKQIVYAEFLQEAMKDLKPLTEEDAKKFYDENQQLFAKKTGDDKGQPMSFEEVKGQIMQLLSRQQQQGAFENVVNEIKTTATIRYNDKLLGVGPKMPPMPPMAPGNADLESLAPETK